MHLIAWSHIRSDLIINECFKELSFLVCQIPIVDDEIRKASGEADAEEDATMQSGTVQRMVTADGTYVTQSAFTSSAKSKKSTDRPPLRGFLMSGDFFVGAALATVLTKLALRFPLVNNNTSRQNVSVLAVIVVL